jgi:ferric iron reductase protein FhuF
MMEILASLPPTKTIHLDKLFQIDVLETFLTEWTTILGAPSTVVTASQFSKRYSSYLFASSLNQLLTSGQFASIQSDRDHIELNYHTGDFQLHINENALQYRSNYCSRQQIDQYIEHYIAGHLLPLWTSISKLTGIKMELLWENSFIYIAWMCLNAIKAPHAIENFIYLTQEADGGLFHLLKNPFSAFTANSVRKKCCLYFMLAAASGDKCKNCPLVCEK